MVPCLCRVLILPLFKRKLNMNFWSSERRVKICFNFSKSRQKS